jgi:hypothetical protein
MALRVIEGHLATRTQKNESRDGVPRPYAAAAKGPEGSLRVGWFRRLARCFGLPGFAQIFAMFEDEGFGFVETGVDLCAFDGVAGRTASNQVAGIFLSFAGSRVDEIHAHHQGVFEAGASVEAAVFAAVIVALQNLEAFGHGHR